MSAARSAPFPSCTLRAFSRGIPIRTLRHLFLGACTAALLAGGCDDDIEFSSEELTGTYDIVEGDAHLGVVGFENDVIEVRVTLGAMCAVHLDGILVGDTAELTGWWAIIDMIFDATGRAIVQKTGSTVVIYLSVDDGQSRQTYQLARDAERPPTQYTGVWAVSFAESPSCCEVETTAHYALDFPESGIGSGTASGDSAAGRAYGTIGIRSAVATPLGRVLVDGPYAVAPEADTCNAFLSEYWLTLVGSVEVPGRSGDPGSGSGTATYSLHPVFERSTTWVARRLE